MDSRIEKVLTFLNTEKTRATYGAVGEALGGYSGQTVGGMLGDRRISASWVVNAETGMPTNYDASQYHPELTKHDEIIRNGVDLLRHMAGLAK